MIDQLASRLVPLGTEVPGPRGPEPALQGLVPARSRPSAVLALLSDNDQPDLVFTERAHTLRRHAGQVSFPGGSVDPGDVSPEAAALREACEEVGLDARGVRLLGRLPGSPLVRHFNTTVVVGVWPGEQELVASPDEVEQVVRWRMTDLADPARRFTVAGPRGGPAFQLDELLLWGFTAHLTDRLLHLGGWERPWDQTRLIEVPERFRRR